ncbi:UDP-glucose 4-epimerase [Lentzea tibetensis]|uniref:UDP-glucose 4-epimerase n=1 Tax=Lentzea tibetensis TaxID=2591470 RepID=A0A563EVJ2_9PSEU|nr:NAD-dependent epimerase/dehydratase family protein [Lentzea tibetensis]TWP51720.1 UDP-glucose 4-epimerase [Lentzea tibetensis]
MRVLVTGASGFLGHAVVAALAAAGHEVIGFSRSEKALPQALSASIVGDVCEPSEIGDAVRDVDGVCHLAALPRVRDSFVKPADYWRTNTGGTINLLHALASAEQPKRIVLASTGAVYGVADKQPTSEDEPTKASNPYARSKLAADQAAADVAAAGLLGAISLRAFNIAGAAAGKYDEDDTRLIPKALAVQAGHAPELVLNGDGSAVRDFVHAEDMADAFVRAFEACTPGRWTAYNVGSGRRTSVRDVVAATEQVTGRALAVRHQAAAQEPPVMIADSTRIRTDLDWQAPKSDLLRIVSDAWDALTRR